MCLCEYQFENVGYDVCVCTKRLIPLSPQFERVWEKLPVNVLGDLEYREFLKHARGTVGIRDKTTDPVDISPLKSASPPSPGLIDMMSSSPPSLGAIDRMSSSPPALQRPKSTGSNLQRSKVQDLSIHDAYQFTYISPSLYLIVHSYK